MPRKNRVDPFGNLLATPSRGTLMGNRGCLHDASGNLIRNWARKPWVICLLEYKGQRRSLMAPGQYTELFFLDEATALAAGHRPCGTCQRSRYEVFKQLWLNANHAELGSGGISIQDLDSRLHGERRVSAANQTAWVTDAKSLPDGVMVTTVGATEEAWLKWREQLYRWTPHGYDGSSTLNEMPSVEVITPKSIVRTLREGYWPRVHETVDSAKSRRYREAVARGNGRLQPESGRVEPPLATDAWRPVEQTGDVDRRLYRLERTPSGKQLFAYFGAILRVTGMDRGEVYPLKKFLGNFATHEQAGRIERVGNGYRLTPEGMEYFADRYRSGSRQHVEEEDVRAMIVRIKAGGEGWEPIG